VTGYFNKVYFNTISTLSQLIHKVKLLHFARKELYY